MKIIDKLRKYLSSEISSGNLQPGSRLPSYWELSRQLGGSYATVQNAMHRLEAEGLVRIEHGNGTYAGGGNRLQITLLTHREYFAFESFGELLKKHVAGKKLDIQLEMVPCLDGALADWSDRIVIHCGRLPGQQPTWNDPMIRELFDELHDDYRQVEDCGRGAFPCFYSSYQIGLNGRMLRKLGLHRHYFTPDFRWWEDYVRRCEKAKLTPVSMNRPPAGKSHIMYFYGFLLAQNGGDPAVFRNDRPLFSTETGQRMLKILDHLHLYEKSTSHSNPGNFFNNDAVMNLMVGSWIYTQNGDPYRPDVRIDDLQTVPYGTGPHRLFPVEYFGMDVSLPDNTCAADRKRVRELMKLMLSRDFQRDWCDLSGMVSLRRDLKPEDYSWNRNEMTQSFFLQKTDRVRNLAALCSPGVYASLSILLDCYLDHGASGADILKLMDIKKNLVREKSQYLSGVCRVEL